MDFHSNLFGKIEEQREGIISLAQRLVQFKSINPPGNEGEISNFLAKELKGLGFIVKQIEYARGRPNIIAVKKGTTSEKKLLCYGHIDVVPAGDLSKWTVDPFEGRIVDGKLHGRGSQDHKFPIAPLIFAWKSLDDLGIRLMGDLIFTFVADEETGGHYGFKRLVEDGYFDDADSMIYGGTGSITRDTIIIGCNGALNYRIVVKGKGAHTAYLESGMNAIINAARVIIELKELADTVNERKHPITGTARMSINMVEGGTRHNIVPDQCIITVDRRVMPSETYEAVANEILQVLEKSKEKAQYLDYEVDMKEVFPPATSDPNSEIVGTLKQAAKAITGKGLDTGGVPASSDYAWYVKRLNRPVAMYAVGNAPILAHSPNEYALIQDIMDTTKVYALTMAEYLGIQPSALGIPLFS